MYLEYYKKQLGECPNFLKKYLKCPSLIRLQKIGYFCGMDYASKNIYQFLEWISRFDHSYTVALLTYRFTKSKKDAIAGLIHDIATPCFSHVVDYMNQDFEKQESTEEFTEDILKNDSYFLKCLEEDHLSLSDIFPFKKFSIVDNERPKLCADRLDGIILTGIGWTKEVDSSLISSILGQIDVYTNEDLEEEIGFTSSDIAKRVVQLSDKIDLYCHSNEDNYMMSLLGDITKKGLEEGLFTYSELYTLTEEDVFQRLESYPTTKKLLDIFYHISQEEVPKTEIPHVKRRIIRPLVQGKRMV